MSAVTRRFSEAFAIASASVQGSCTIGNTAATPLARSFSQEAGSSLAEPGKDDDGLPGGTPSDALHGFSAGRLTVDRTFSRDDQISRLHQIVKFHQVKEHINPRSNAAVEEAGYASARSAGSTAAGRELTFAPCFSKSPATTRSPASKRFTSSASAPFCGPKT